MTKPLFIILIGLSLAGFLGSLSRDAAGQDIDAKIKKLEELEARLDAKLERLEKIEKLDALQARVDAKLKRLEEFDRQLDSGLQPVAVSSSSMPRDGGRGIMGLFLAAPAALTHADYPMFELFGGGQYANLAIAGRQDTGGWVGGLGVNFHRNFGLAADFGGTYGNTRVFSCSIFSCGSKNISLSLYHLGIGPQITVRDEALNAFFHVLFGFAHSSVAGQGQTDFALSPGFGLDINFGKSVAYRLLEADYMVVNSQRGSLTHNARVQSGLVYRFGY